MTSTVSFQPDWASPPGDTLVAMLRERSMSQTELAERLGVSLKHVNRVVKGAASISPELALGLEKVLGAPATFWITREAQYQADVARQRELDQLGAWVEWAAGFPLAVLRKRGLVPAGGRGAEGVQHLLNFLGVAHPEQWNSPQVSYRKSQKIDSDARALGAWLREGELEADAIRCEPYDEDRFLEALDEARALTRKDPAEWWPRLQELCAAVGVAVVITDTYPGARVNGATRWLAADKALIQLSLRYRWEDIFWFTFFHEAGHVILHRKKALFIEEAGKRECEDPKLRRLEEEADRFASRILIPPPFDRRLSQLPLEEVDAFADRVGIAPAVVVGRMMHDGMLPWNRGNDLRRRLVFVEDDPD